MRQHCPTSHTVWTDMQQRRMGGALSICPFFKKKKKKLSPLLQTTSKITKQLLYEYLVFSHLYHSQSNMWLFYFVAHTWVRIVLWPLWKTLHSFSSLWLIPLITLFTYTHTHTNTRDLQLFLLVPCPHLYPLSHYIIEQLSFRYEY